MDSHPMKSGGEDQNENFLHSATSEASKKSKSSSQPPPFDHAATSRLENGNKMSKSTVDVQGISKGQMDPPPRISPHTSGMRKVRDPITLAPIPDRKRSSKNRKKKCDSQQALLRASAYNTTASCKHADDDNHGQQALRNEERGVDMNRVESRSGESFISNGERGLLLEEHDPDPTSAPTLSATAINTHIANYVQKKLNSDRISFSSSHNEKKQQTTTPKGEWKVVEISHDSSPPPCQRSLHTASLWKHYFLVFGGYSGDARKNDFHWFNFETRQWSLVHEGIYNGNPPSPRDRHTAGVYNDCFYVFGGFDGTSRVNDFYEYNFLTSTWRQVPFNFRGNSESPPSPRHSHSSVMHKNSFYVFGGYDGSYRCDFHEYNIQTQRWRSINPRGRSPRARYRATCCIHENTMILFGGHDGTRHLADMHIFDFDSQIWAAVTDFTGTPPINRDSHLSVVMRNFMFVFGGSAGQALKDMHQLSLNGDTDNAEFIHEWKPVVCKGEMRHRFCHVGQVYDDNLYIFGTCS